MLQFQSTIVQCVFLQNWNKLNKSGGGPWPEERTGHAACCLNYGQQFPQLLVTGGLDRQRRPLADVWILDIHRGKWRKVRRLKHAHLFPGSSNLLHSNIVIWGITMLQTDFRLTKHFIDFYFLLKEGDTLYDKSDKNLSLGNWENVGDGGRLRCLHGKVDTIISFVCLIVINCWLHSVFLGHSLWP